LHTTSQLQIQGKRPKELTVEGVFCLIKEQGEKKPAKKKKAQQDSQNF
jgi:hypothetical protein